MTSFDIAASAGALCGLLMVIGGMILLYTGAVSLSKTSAEEAATLEFKRLFRLTTHYPALGLFIIGLAFITVSVILSRPADNQVTMTGSLTSTPDTPVDKLDPEFLTLSLESSLKPYFDPNTKTITISGDPTAMWQVVITYPGMIAQKPVQGNGKRTISLGSIALVRVADKPPVNPANIAPMPSGLSARVGGL